MELIGFGYLVLCALAAWVASYKGRSATAIFFLSLFASPIVGLVVALVLRPKNQSADGEPAPTIETHGRCPMCKELVRRDALKCKHCGGELTSETILVQKARVVNFRCSMCDAWAKPTDESCGFCHRAFEHAVATTSDALR